MVLEAWIQTSQVLPSMCVYTSIYGTFSQLVEETEMNISENNVLAELSITDARVFSCKLLVYMKMYNFLIPFFVTCIKTLSTKYFTGTFVKGRLRIEMVN